MKRILAFLPANRLEPGLLHLFDHDGVLLHTAACFGKADNTRAAAEGNPDRDPVQPYGDTPAGDYKPSKVERFDPPHQRMGSAFIPLHGASGDAMRAQLSRTGLGIHAGKGDGALIPTFGCVRVRDRDMGVLAREIGSDPVTVTIEDMENANGSAQG